MLTMLRGRNVVASVVYASAVVTSFSVIEFSFKMLQIFLPKDT